MSSPPPNWREGRQRYLVGFLRLGMGVVVVASLASLLLPDDASHVAAVVMIAALVGLPVLRVGWLATRWLTLGDWRFAGVAFGLLLVVASGAVLAFAR